MNQGLGTKPTNAARKGWALRHLKLLLPVTLVAVLISAIYLHTSYKRYESFARNEAEILVESAKILLDQQIKGLTRQSEINPNSPGYQSLKKTLMLFRGENSQIRFAYLLAREGDRVYFLMDSEPSNSEDYSPYGEEYSGTMGSIDLAFETRRTVVSGYETDRWGSWVSALTPVIDQGNPVQVLLGFDYPAEVWRFGLLSRMAPDIVVILSLAAFAIALAWVLAERQRLARLSRHLAADEELFRTVFDQAPIGIAISTPGNMALGRNFEATVVNRMFRQIVGRTDAELRGLGWLDVTHPDDQPVFLDRHERLNGGGIDEFSQAMRYLRPDGSVVWVNAKTVRMRTGEAEEYSLVLVEDITARRSAENALLESERSKTVLLSHLPGLAYRCRYDPDWTMEFVSEGCKALTGYDADSLLGNRDISFNSLIAPEYRRFLWDEWERILPRHENFRNEYEIITRDGLRKWVLELGQGIYEGDSVIALEGIVIDITSQKDNEARILYMSEHDSMTGLVNRSYYERIRGEMDVPETLPLSVAVCDIDGLHLVNDVFGVQEGDRLIVESARLIEGCARPRDVLIRTGGDEFTLIMPSTDAAEADQMNLRIKEAVAAFNSRDASTAYGLSLSVGCATRTSLSVRFTEVVRSAGESMHYHKLLESRSAHNSILSSMMATMLARSRETEAHGERMASLSRRMGESLSLEQKALDELELYAILHDIGKVGVDDSILNKPGKLDPGEWELMKKHSEIGYRIAASASELSHVADYILCHHERWDGKGYPRGLSGEQIPLLSRLLAIVDAYDAMTETRVYRAAMSSEEALQEIERGAGTQFDPALAVRFCEMMRN